MPIEDTDEDLTGKPADDVPKREPDGDCNGKRTKGRGGESVFVGYCGQPEGWGCGPDITEGRCKHHGGLNSGENGQGGTEGNTNAVTHGAYADHNAYYQDVLDDAMRAFVDDVFEDYVEEYQKRHGEASVDDVEDLTEGIPLGIETELFRIAVTHAKDIGLDRWASEKPDGLESGHPLVDKETNLVPIGEGMVETERSYRESVVQAAQKRLSTDRRQWLKDLGLLEDPDSQQAQATQTLAQVINSE